MADNVAITPGSGTTIAADEVVDGTLGTVKVQYVKIMDGTVDGTSKQTVNSDGSTYVREYDSLGQAQYNFPAGFVRTSDEPRQVFYDPFDAALDTTNVWTTPTVGNSATLASVTSGTMSLATGTTASGWSKLFSLPTFKLPIPGWMGFSFAINLPDGAAPTANSYRFWGSGTPATTPTTAAPLTDAVGFELTTAGKLFAVVYNNGIRTAIQDLSSSGNNKQPLDTSSHRYIVYIRTDRAYWYIDSLATPVATSSFQAPAIQTLPITFVAVGGSTPPATTTQIQCNGAVVWDTGKNATQLADGTFPWRKARISSAGALQVDNSGVTQPVSIAATVSDNITQFGGVALSTGLGASGTGIPRVTLSTDSSVSLGTSQGKTVVLKTGTLASSATTPDQVVLTYTITTGKTFYLCSLDCLVRLTTFAATATLFGTISLENPSGTKLWTMDMVGTGVTNQYILQLIEPVPMSSATVVRVVCTPAAATAFTWRANFAGYEK